MLLRRGIMSSTGGGGGDAGFSPLDLASLQLWIEGETGYTDKSDNSFTVTNDGSLNTNTLNGLKVFTFDGTNDRMSVPDDAAAFDWSSGLTFIAAAKFDTVTGWRGVMGHDDGSGNSSNKVIWGTTTQVSKMDLHFNGAFTGASAVADTALGTDWAVYSITVNSSRDYEFFEDITSDGDGLAFATNIPNPSAALYVGWAGEGTSYFDGDIAEIIICNGRELDADILETVNYLKDKYSI